MVSPVFGWIHFSEDQTENTIFQGGKPDLKQILIPDPLEVLPAGNPVQQVLQEKKGRIVHPHVVDHDPTAACGKTGFQFFEQGGPARGNILVLAGMKICMHGNFHKAVRGQRKVSHAPGYSLETQAF